MKEISKCKGTLWTSFIEKGNSTSGSSTISVQSDRFKLNRTAKRAFIWRSLIFLCIIVVFFTRFVLLSVLVETKENTSNQLDSTASYVGRNIRSIPQTTTPASIFPTKSTGDEDTNDRLTGPTTSRSDQNENTENCTQPAILEFPPDGLTRQQRRAGWILLHILFALYCFWLLAIICDDYFVPAIEQICSTLSLQKDVVGATFMATATSSPELFMNCVGTFVTKGDIGVSTIVGSAVFNILAVPACCGFFVLGHFVQLDWWPVTRDCLMYCVAILALIGTLYDGRVMWYEALLLVIGYFLYMAVMYYNDKMAVTARKLISKYRRRYRPRPFREVTEFTALLSHCNPQLDISKTSLDAEIFIGNGYKSLNDTGIDAMSNSFNSLDCSVSDFADGPWHKNGRNPYEYICRWPLTFLLYLTIPDSRRHPSCRYLTFFLSISWIGVISYMVAYVITIIGDTLDIPDSVMGLTILSAGMSVPEAVSSVIVARQGHGAMGISNSIGSNTFDILLCLGIPWFIKAYFLPTNPGQLWVSLEAEGLTYAAIFLLATVCGLFIAFIANRFILDWKIGAGCSIMYLGFLIVATLIQLNVFFPANLPVCEH